MSEQWHPGKADSEEQIGQLACFAEIVHQMLLYRLRLIKNGALNTVAGPIRKALDLMYATARGRGDAGVRQENL